MALAYQTTAYDGEGDGGCVQSSEMGCCFLAWSWCFGFGWESLDFKSCLGRACELEGVGWEVIAIGIGIEQNGETGVVLESWDWGVLGVKLGIG